MIIRKAARWPAVALLTIAVMTGTGTSDAKAGGAVPLTLFCQKGQYCYGIAKRADGRIDFRIRSFNFRGSYKLCVTDPMGLRVCHRYRLGRFTSSSIIDWKQNFPDAREGQYRVEWRRHGGKLGPAAYFRSSQFGARGR